MWPCSVFITVCQAIKMSRQSLFHFGLLSKCKDADVSVDAGSSDLKPAAKKIKLESDSQQRAFQEVWLSQFDWLEYKSDSKCMFCRICRAASVQNSFTKEGAGMLIMYILIFL